MAGLVNANRRMSKTELIRAAWGSDDVEEAQLYKRVKVVRDLLAGIGLGGHLKTHPRFGYEMRVADVDVDALLFQRLVLEADEAGAEHRTEDEIGHLRHALRLWRGPHPLSNVPSDAFHQEIVALEQRHKRAAVRLFDLELARDHHERVLGELMLMAGHYPADRRLCEQLMLAEYRCGHLADVASAYERYRETLEEETGGEPDALLRNLHFAVARGDHEAIGDAAIVTGWLDMDDIDAICAIRAQVESSRTADVARLDGFLLATSAGHVDLEVRTRLVKFYAMFKIVEMLRYERFRGFPG